jgi:hypothetical protein
MHYLDTSVLLSLTLMKKREPDRYQAVHVIPYFTPDELLSELMTELSDNET